MTLFIYILLLSPEFKNYEDLGLKSFLASLCIMLIIAVVWLYKSKETRLKEQSEKYGKLLAAKETEIKNLNDARLSDKEKYTEKYVEMSQKLFQHFQQSTEFFRNAK